MTGTPTRRLGVEIKVTLLRRGLSGRQLAAKLGESQTWVSSRLTGTTPIDVNDLHRIAEALDISAVELLEAAYQRKEVRTRVNDGFRAVPIRTTRTAPGPSAARPPGRPTPRAGTAPSPARPGFTRPATALRPTG